MKKILVVDDEPSMRFLITSTLEDEEYTLIEASDGLEAYELIKNELPDLIIMDVMMPGLTGYELCAKIRKESWGTDMLVIMLTAKGQKDDKDQSVKAGADYYMRKPFSPMELIDQVDSMLDG